MVTDFNKKKVLVVGLGSLGGGVATVKWLVDHGASVTVTDAGKKKNLEKSIRALKSCGKKVRFVLGRHDKKDFVSHDVIVVNPAVKISGNPFLSLAKKKNVPVTNDLGIFLGNAKNPIIAVTGTRGKTTTANWIAYFLSGKYPGAKASGNSSDDALLKLLPRLERRRNMPAVLELSSFQLELANQIRRAPDIAVVTNLYRDHLNRHGSMEKYARAKANIFLKQTEDQILVLNRDNEWTEYFLKRNSKSRLAFVSLDRPVLGKNSRFLVRANKRVIFSDGKTRRTVFSKKTAEKIESLGEHNIYNFLCAALAAHYAGVSWSEIEKKTETLPQIPYRQETVIKRKDLAVINDTAATSPDGTLAALRRFGGKDTALIAGGTDKKLKYSLWAQEVKKHIVPNNLFLLEGSATRKMIRELNKAGYFRKGRPQTFGSLEELLGSVKKRLETDDHKPTTVLFSPAAASFEKFKNEFDRGEKFNALAKKAFGR